MNLMSFFTAASAAMVIIDHVSAIVGGVAATAEQFPYVASLRKHLILHVCGGAVISQSHVLTAAHCVHGEVEVNYRVVVGSTELCSSRKMEKVKKFHVHPQYVAATLKSGSSDSDDCDVPEVDEEPVHDIAVIEVFGCLIAGENVAAIALPRSYVGSGARCSFAGWGATSESQPDKVSSSLLQTELTTLSPGMCEVLGCPNTKDTFCVRNEFLQSAPCNGDSGGPLVCGGKVAGIYSVSTCDPSDAARFVKIAEYVPFINFILATPGSSSSSGPLSDL